MTWPATSTRLYQEPRRRQRLGKVHQVEAAAQVSVAQDGRTPEPRVVHVLKRWGAGGGVSGDHGGVASDQGLPLLYSSMHSTSADLKMKPPTGPQKVLTSSRRVAVWKPLPGTTQGAAGRLTSRSSQRGVVVGNVSSTRAILAEG